MQSRSGPPPRALHKQQLPDDGSGKGDKQARSKLPYQKLRGSEECIDDDEDELLLKRQEFKGQTKSVRFGRYPRSNDRLAETAKNNMSETRKDTLLHMKKEGEAVHTLLGSLNVGTLRSANPIPQAVNKNVRNNYRKKSSQLSLYGTSLVQITIAGLFKQHPNIVDGNKLKVVGRDITTVALGTIPHQCAKVTTAYLSNNKLSCLHGLRALKSLTCLSVAHNLLSRMQAIYDLGSSCPCLEVLVLEGNPICAAPYYRQNVMCSLPMLKQLDGRDITEVERRNAPFMVNREDTAISLLVTGACHVQLLENIFKLALVHDEFVASQKYNMDVFDSTEEGVRSRKIDVHMLSEIWDYEGELNDSEKRDLQEAMRLELQREMNRERFSSHRTKEVGVDEAFDAAFKTIQLRQHKATSALETAIHAPSLHSDYGRLICERFYNDINQAIRSRKIDEQKSSSQAKQQASKDLVHKTESLRKEKVPEKTAQMLREGRIDNISQASQGTITQESNISHSVSSKEEDDRQEFIRIIETQQNQLKLRKQLVQIEEQSRSSVALAEKELSALQEDMEHSLDLQIRLETRALEAEAARDAALLRANDADNLESQLTELLRRLTTTEESLAMETSTRLALETKIEQLMEKNADLQAILDVAEDHKTATFRSTRLCERVVKRRILIKFYDAVRDSIEKREHEVLADIFHRKNAVRRAWLLFSRAFIREKAIHIFRFTYTKSKLSSFIQAWKEQCTSSETLRQLLAEADKHHGRRLAQTSLRAFVINASQSLEMRVLARIVSARSCLRRWRRYHNGIVRPKRRKEVMSLKLRNQMLMWRAIQSWTFSIAAAAAHREMMSASTRLRSAQLLGLALTSWVHYVKHKRITKVQSETANTVFVGMRLRRWRQNYYKSKSYRLRIARFLNERSLRLYRRSFMCWLEMSNDLKDQKILEISAQRHFQRRVQKLMISKWYWTLLNAKKRSRQRAQSEKLYLNHFFFKWKSEAHAARKMERALRQADAHFCILLAKSLRFVLLSWLDIATSKKYFRNIQKTLLRRVQLSMLGRTFRRWKLEYMHSLRAKLESAEERLSSMISIQLQTDQKIVDAGHINDDLSMHVQQMRGQLLTTKALAAEQDTKILQLQQDYDNALKSEREANAQVQTTNDQLQRSQQEIEKLRHVMRANSNDSSENLAQVTLKIEELNSEVETLKLMLLEKRTLLATCEAVLEDAALQLEATAATCDSDTMERISEVASSLRLLLNQDKDTEPALKEKIKSHFPPSPSPSPSPSPPPPQPMSPLTEDARTLIAHETPNGIVQGVHYDFSHEIADLQDKIASRLSNSSQMSQQAIYT